MLQFYTEGRMKILLIHTADYLHHQQPSRQHAIFEILSKTHEVYVLHFHVSRGEERKTNLHVVEATRYDTQNPVLHYTLNAPYHYQVISDLIKEKGIEIIVTTNVLASTAAILAGKKHNVPVIFDLSDWLPDSAAAYAENKYLKEIVRTVVFWITKWNLKRCKQVITVSPSLKKRLWEIKVPSLLITNGVDTDTFFPMSKEAAKSVFNLTDSFVIGFAGAMEEWYDVMSMVRLMPDVLKSYPDTKLFLVGGSLFTNYEKNLRKLRAKLNLHDQIIFTGFVPHDQLPAYIAAMDICAIPLQPKEWRDIALPNKFFEYSAMGKPILMTPMQDVMALGRDLYIYRSDDEYLKCIDLFRKGDYIERPVIAENSWKSKAEQFEAVFHEVIQ
jgi:phosphatidylinositol alpha-1,6-mannosyltransferase